jgi:hypothetical protein
MGSGLRLNSEPFRKDLQKINKSSRIMSVQEMADAGHIIKEHTYLKVPFDEGYLVEGFGQRLRTKSGAFYELNVYFSAEANPFTDYDYAYIQEIMPYNHPKRGEQFYLGKGMKKAERDIWNNLNMKFEKVLMTGAYW